MEDKKAVVKAVDIFVKHLQAAADGQLWLSIYLQIVLFMCFSVAL